MSLRTGDDDFLKASVLSCSCSPWGTCTELNNVQTPWGEIGHGVGIFWLSLASDMLHRTICLALRVFWVNIYRVINWFWQYFDCMSPFLVSQDGRGCPPQNFCAQVVAVLPETFGKSNQGDCYLCWIEDTILHGLVLFVILLLRLEDAHWHVIGPFNLLRHMYSLIRDWRSHLGHVRWYGMLLVDLHHRKQQLVDDDVPEVIAKAEGHLQPC